ncbi:hypothetical protein Tco_1097402 [Tanacetum coccineum]
MEKSKQHPTGLPTIMKKEERETTMDGKLLIADGEKHTRNKKPRHPISSPTYHWVGTKLPCGRPSPNLVEFLMCTWRKKRRLMGKILGLPPHAWHEVAFTRIDGIYGHVIFPEKCNKNNNNLVSGKVCILTKSMDLIQHNMPIIIDDVHFCVRIQEIQGDSNDDNNEEDDDDYLDDDDFDVDLMLDNEHGVIGDLSGG